MQALIRDRPSQVVHSRSATDAPGYDISRMLLNGDHERRPAIAVWGEGFSWTGPGGAWFNLES